MQRWLLFALIVGVLEPGLWAQDAPHPVFALDHQDAPWVAWVERQGTVTVGRVAQWTGSAWAPVGGPLHHEATQNVTSVSLALGPDGTPWVAWSELPTPVNPTDGKSAGWVHVAQWTKTAWAEPTPPPTRSGQPGADNPVVRVDAQGKPWVMWTEVAPGAKVEAVGLGALTGSAWTLIDDPGLSEGLHLSPRSRELALGPDGPLVVLSHQVPAHGIQLFVSRWDGQHLVALGQGLNVNPEAWAGFPSLALDPQGQPTVAFVEAADHLKMVVKQWSAGAWHLLGTPGSLGLRSPKLALTPAGSAIVVAVENLVGVTVRQRSNAGWVDLGADVSGPRGEDPSVVLDSQGNPWVLWSETTATGVHLGLKQWLGTKWKSWSTPQITASPLP